MKILDCRTFKCPQPVVETRKAILSEPGTPLKVLVADEVARDNVTRLAVAKAFKTRIVETDDGFSLELTPGSAEVAEQGGAVVQGKTVTFISSETMGSGDDELGRILLKNYLITLTEMDTIPDALLFINGGVKLAAEGSEAIEALEKLANLGVDIASCGLCLEFFDLKGKGAVGRVTNMLDIAETLQNAGRIIRP